MAETVTREQVAALAAQLPPDERRRLAEQLLRELAESPPAEQLDWMSLRGIAPNLLDGEDAQAWVTRTRREADEHRERQWREHLS
jgi:hypothetical protein